VRILYRSLRLLGPLADVVWGDATPDHRIIDGREAVTFLVLVKKLIEDPAMLNLYN